jgi:hypothetical protein
LSGRPTTPRRATSWSAGIQKSVCRRWRDQNRTRRAECSGIGDETYRGEKLGELVVSVAK